MMVVSGRFAPSWLTDRPIAHRGLHDWRKGIVENTLGAFKAAVDAGYTIECDLQISRDGEAVLFHDDTLDRVMETTGLINAFTVDQLKAMAYRHSTESIPTLRELLDLVKGDVPLVIELKPQWDGNTALAERTLDLLRDYSGAHCLMSFDPEVVAAVRARSPDTLRGFVTDGAFDSFYDRLPPAQRTELRTLSCLAAIEPHFVSVDIDMLPWAPIESLRRSGMPLIAWTIRSEHQAELALRYVDQVTFEGYRA